jgi:predicted RNase H-like HicB family nuclease
MPKLPLNIIAEWDPEASVWVATSEDIKGLAIDAPTLERLVERLPAVIEDLIEFNHPELAGLTDIPFKVHASRLEHLARAV